MIAYFLPAIILLGIITSYEDIKFGKIRNKWILAGIGFSVFINLILYLSSAISAGLLFALLINFFASLALSFILWNFGFWSAGDGKLFIAYSALIPVAVYSNQGFGFFPSFALFINTIVPYFVFLLAKSLFSSKAKRIKSAFFESAKKFPALFLSLLAIGWIADFFNKKVLGASGLISTFASYAIVYFIIDFFLGKIFSRFKIKKIKTWHVYALLLFARIILNFQGIFNYSFLSRILFTAVFYTLLLRTAYGICEFGLAKKVKIKDLKKGDIVAQGIFKSEKKYFKNDISAKDFIFNRSIIKLESEGLTEGDVKKIKELAKRKKLRFSSINIYETIPFAPIMFLGVLLTVLSSGIFINLIYYFI